MFLIKLSGDCKKFMHTILVGQFASKKETSFPRQLHNFCATTFDWIQTTGRILLQVHLIEGIIDQVEGTVHVSWVQPRVLGIPQITSLRDRLDNWLKKVNTALKSIEAETPDLVASWFFPPLWFASAHCNNSLTEKGKKLERRPKKKN